MLVLGSRFDHTPVMGIQTSSQLGTTSRALVDPRNLTIAAYEIVGPALEHQPSYLRTNEIREIGPLGMIIDSHDEIVGLEDVIALKKLIDLDFEIINLPVVDEHRRRLGKVQDYTLETTHFAIQQLHVKRGMFKSLTDTGLLIHRSQVVEITPDAIIVKGTGKRRTVQPVTEATRHEYVNPFRQPKPQTDSASTD